MTLKEIADDVATYIDYMRDEGKTDVEVSPEVVALLGHASAAPAPPAAPVPVSQPAPPTAAPVPAPASPETAAALSAIAARVAACTQCALHQTRTNVVPGQGNVVPEIMFVGEAPGADEDQQGLAFVGRAGQLLTKMIAAMGLTREDVFIGNILKCRPPNNRPPLPEEMETCLPFLREQIAILKPRVIVAMGATAVKGLVELPKGVGITKARGRWMKFEGIDFMPTLHPAYLLRNPAAKRDVWEDLKAVLTFLGRPIPPVKKG